MTDLADGVVEASATSPASAGCNGLVEASVTAPACAGRFKRALGRALFVQAPPDLEDVMAQIRPFSCRARLLLWFGAAAAGWPTIILVCALLLR